MRKNKKYLLSISLYVFCTIFLPVLSIGQSIELKIMSFNIQQPYGTDWDARKDSVVAILNSENAHIIGTQEAVNFQRNYILSNTQGYSYYGIGRDGEDNGEGSWVFFKTTMFVIDSAASGNFWLSATPEIPSRFDGLYNRICTYVKLQHTASGKSFYVFNIHNYMPHENNLRAKAAQMLMQRVAAIAANETVILTGDFNSPEEDEVTLWLKTGSDNPMHLNDTYRDVFPEGFVTTGFGTKLDYIYCPRKLVYETKKTYVVSNFAGASDHLPIVAYIILSQN